MQRQKLYQSDLRPVYQRGPRSGFYMKAYLAIFAVGMVGTAHGLWNSAWVSARGESAREGAREGPA